MWHAQGNDIAQPWVAMQPLSQEPLLTFQQEHLDDLLTSLYDLFLFE
jgi:hypothetical protein